MKPLGAVQVNRHTSLLARPVTLTRTRELSAGLNVCSTSRSAWSSESLVPFTFPWLSRSAGPGRRLFEETLPLHDRRLCASPSGSSCIFAVIMLQYRLLENKLRWTLRARTSFEALAAARPDDVHPIERGFGLQFCAVHAANIGELWDGRCADINS